MALQSSGAISLNNVNVELGNSGTAYITMGSAAVRDLFGVASGAISLSDGYGASSFGWGGSRGVFMGGYNGGTRYNNIDYITIATTGNAIDFGDLTRVADGAGSCSNGTRGVNAGGQGVSNSKLFYFGSFN